MNRTTLLNFLKISTFFIFSGRAYQHLFWDAPYRSVFWDQQLLEPIINFVFNTSWQSYVTNLNTDHAIQFLTKSIGGLYTVCAIISLTITETSKKWQLTILKLGAVSIVVLAMLITKNKFYHLIMFFEHAIQFGVPIALIYYLKTRNIHQLIFKLKIFIALAFTCHGMYAIGVFYPLPGNFVTMTLNILPITETSAKNLLFIAGIIDFIIAIGLFIPKVAKTMLLYACFWGFITAFARIISGLSYDVSLSIMHQYMYLVLYRIPHGLIPLLVYLYLANRNNQKSKAIKNLVSI
ncbi:hypothetical protein SAMN04487765_1190 [Tenacibaculum sp. MAR_2010_89]|uniref:hypothetical protein n=1 Tax=Tenacibaculum sp. MAR_2010_89 TaxID=1250198 RepID=UPI00089D6C1B|nr:hypothetical protein [Tenacibaculum sp. MAR_2010_89]SEE03982.1 hypothetical protein SAMN04487765_1190 [Tenacibaculum sp. MAR_2010_89]